MKKIEVNKRDKYFLILGRISDLIMTISRISINFFIIMFILYLASFEPITGSFVIALYFSIGSLIVSSIGVVIKYIYTLYDERYVRIEKKFTSMEKIELGEKVQKIVVCRVGVKKE